LFDKQEKIKWIKRKINFLLLIISIGTIAVSLLANKSLRNLNKANLNRYESYRLSEELRLSSDQLTLMARAYVVTGNQKYYDFFHEILDIRNGITPRPEKYEWIYWDFRMPENSIPPQVSGESIPFMKLLLEANFAESEFMELAQAQKNSDKLVEIEEKAFKLTSQALTEENFRYSLMREKALDLVYGEEYLSSKVEIMSHINNFMKLQENRTSEQVDDARMKLKYLTISTLILYILLLIIFLTGEKKQRKFDYNLILELEKEVEGRTKSEDRIKQSLEEKNVLLHELYHRTENTLQQIQSLLTLQAGKSPENEELQELVHDSETRIQTIASVHQLLYKANNLSELSIRDYILDLCNMLKSSYELYYDQIIFKLDIMELTFLFDEAIPLGIIINELITNSLKHAFPNHRKGEISLSLKKGSGNNYIFEYSDNGIGFPEGFDFRNHNGIGSSLIYGIAMDQLKGKIATKNNNGVFWRFEIPKGLYINRILNIN
jgi:two-component sensor histidine kinase